MASSVLSPDRDWRWIVQYLVYAVFDGKVREFCKVSGVSIRSVYAWMSGQTPNRKHRWKLFMLYMQYASQTLEKMKSASDARPASQDDKPQPGLQL